MKHTTITMRAPFTRWLLATVALCGGCVLEWDRVWDQGAPMDARPPDIEVADTGKPDAKVDPNDWVVALGARTAAIGVGLDLDTDGNVHVIGSYSGKIVNANGTLESLGDSDLVSVKVTGLGALDWTVSAGSKEADRGYDVLISAGGERYVAGYYGGDLNILGRSAKNLGMSDGVVIKLSNEGIHWMTPVSSKLVDTASCLAMNKAGTEVWVAGWFGDTATLAKPLSSAGNRDLFVARLHPETGKIEWAGKAGGKGADAAYAVTLDKAGDVYLAGYFQGTATFGSHALTSSGKDDYEVFVAKVSATSGAFVWATSGGGPKNDEARGLDLDSKGNVYITGYHAGPATFGKTTLAHHQDGDLFVARLDPKGVFQWAVSTSGSLSELGNALAVDHQDRLVVVGYHQGSTTLGGKTVKSAGGRDVYLVGLDTGGEVQWVDTAGGPKNDEGLDLDLDTAGRPVVTGYYMATATFNGRSIKAEGDAIDAFVWKRPLPGEKAK